MDIENPINILFPTEEATPEVAVPVTPELTLGELNAFNDAGQFQRTGNINDGDGVLQGTRVAYNREVEADKDKSYDAWETDHGAEFNDSPAQAKKLTKQRKALAQLLEVDVSEITNDDVFAMGEASKKRAEEFFFTEDGLNPVVVDESNTFKSKRKGDNRTLGHVFRNANGDDIRDHMNNPQDNAAYFSKFNTQGRFENENGKRTLSGNEEVSDFDAQSGVGRLENAAVTLGGAVDDITNSIKGTVAEGIGAIAGQLVAGESDITPEDETLFRGIQTKEVQARKEAKLQIAKENPEATVGLIHAKKDKAIAALYGDDQPDDQGPGLFSNSSKFERERAAFQANEDLINSRTDKLLRTRLSEEEISFMDGTGEGRRSGLLDKNSAEIVEDDRFKTLKTKLDVKSTITDFTRSNVVETKDGIDEVTGRIKKVGRGNRILQEKQAADTDVKALTAKADAEFKKGNFVKATGILIGAGATSAVNNPEGSFLSAVESVPTMAALVAAPTLSIGLLSSETYEDGKDKFFKERKRLPQGEEQAILLGTSVMKSLVAKGGADFALKQGGKKVTELFSTALQNNAKMAVPKATAMASTLAVASVVEGGEEVLESVLEQIGTNQGKDKGKLINEQELYSNFIAGMASSVALTSVMSAPSVPASIKADLQKYIVPTVKGTFKQTTKVLDPILKPKATPKQKTQAVDKIAADIAADTGVSVEEVKTPNIEVDDTHDFQSQLTGQPTTPIEPAKSDLTFSEKSDAALQEFAKVPADALTTEKGVLELKGKLVAAERAIQNELVSIDIESASDADLVAIENKRTQVANIAAIIRQKESELAPAETSPLQSAADIGTVLTRGSAAIADVDTSGLSRDLQDMVSQLSQFTGDRVSTEVRADTVNSQGKAGLGLHMSNVGLAVVNNDLTGAANAVQSIVNFKVLQQNKHKAIQKGFNTWVSQGSDPKSPVKVEYGANGTYTVKGTNTQGFLNNLQKEVDLLDNGAKLAADLGQAHFDPEGFTARKTAERRDEIELSREVFEEAANTPEAITPQTNIGDVAGNETSEAGEVVRAESAPTTNPIRTRQQILRQGVDVRRQMDSLDAEIAAAPTLKVQNGLIAEQNALREQRQELLAELREAPVTAPEVVPTPAENTKSSPAISNQPEVDVRKGADTKSELEVSAKSAFDLNQVEATAEANNTPITPAKVLGGLISHASNVFLQKSNVKEGRGSESVSTTLLKPLSEMLTARKNDSEVAGIIGKSDNLFKDLGEMSKDRFTFEEWLAISDIEGFAHEIDAALDLVAPTVGSKNGLKIRKNDDSGQILLFKQQANRSPVMQLMDEQGQLPMQVKDAIAIAALDWFQTSASKTQFQTPSDVYRFFGKPEESGSIDPEILNFMADKGVHLTPEALKVGRAVMRNLNIKQADDPSLDALWETRMAQSIGDMAFTAMANMTSSAGTNRGYIKFDSIPVSDLTKVGGNELTDNLEPNALAKFVRTPIQRGENNGLIYAGDGSLLQGNSLSELSEFTNSQPFKSVMKSIQGSDRNRGGVTAIPNTTAPEYYTGTSTALSPLAADYVVKLNSQALIKNPQWGLFEAFSEHKNDWLRIGGGVTPTIDPVTGEASFPELHDAEAIAAVGKNLGLTLSYDAMVNHSVEWEAGLRDVQYDIGRTQLALESEPNSAKLTENLSKLETELQGYENGDIYLNHRVISTGRTSDGRSALSVQNNKDQRNALTLKSAVETIDITDDFHKRAVIAGLIEPLDLNEVAAAKDPMAEFTAKYLDEKGNAADPVIRAGIEAIQAHTRGDDFNRAAIADAVVQIGEGHHTLSGLMVVASWSTTIQNGDTSFVSYGYTEVDGTTNGVIASLRQLVGGFDPAELKNPVPGSKTEFILATLNAGGAVFQEQDYVDGIDYLEENPDAYEKIGEIAGKLLQEATLSVQSKTIPTLEGNKFTALEERNKLRGIIRKTLKQGAVPEANQMEALELAEQNLERAESELGVKVFGPTVPNFELEGGRVSGKIRKIMKSIVMPGGYQAGDKALGNALFNAWLNGVYSEMAAAVNESQSSPNGPYKVTLDNINETLENAGMSPVTLENAKQVFAPEVVRTLKEIYTSSLGRDITNAYRKTTGDFDVNAKTINAAHGVMGHIVTKLLNDAYAKAESEQAGALSDTQKMDIRKQLQEQGVFIGHQQFGSTGFKDAVSIISDTQETVSSDRGGEVSTGFREGVIKTDVHRLVDGTFQTTEGEPTSSRSSSIKETVPSPDVSVSGVVGATHHMDGNVQAEAHRTGDADAINVFDAKIYGFLAAQSESTNTNKAFESVMRDWSLWDATNNQLQHLITQYPDAENDVNIEEFFAPYDQESELGNKFAPTWVKADGSTGHFSGLSDFMAYLSDSVVEGNNQRQLVNDSMVINAQFRIKDGFYRIPQTNTGVRGSSDQRIDKTSFDEANRAQATPEIVSNLFHKYLDKNNIHDSATHKARLSNLMQKQILPLLQKSLGYTLSVSESRGITGGLIEGQNVYIRTSDTAIRQFSTDMSDAEVLTHEFLHPIVEAGLADNSKDLVNLRRLQQAAINSNTFTPDSLVDPQDIDQAQALEKAQRLYDYVTGDLQEFMVFGLSNDVIRTALEQEQVSKANPLGMVDKLFKIMGDLITRLTGKVIGRTAASTSIASNLDTMIQGFDTTARTHLARQVAATVNNKYVTAGRGFLAEKVAAPISAWGRTVSYKVPVGQIAETGQRPSAVETLSALAKAPARVFDTGFQKAAVAALKPVLDHKQSFWAKTAREAMGPDQHDAKYHVELSKVNEHVESAALNQSLTIKQKVSGAFSRNLKTSEHKLLADTLLRGDLKAFKGSMSELSTLISDTVELETAISTTIANLNSSDRTWVVNQARNLASVMINGEAKLPNGNLNAFNIVSGLQRNGGNRGLDFADLQAVDELKSLYAIKEMSVAQRNELAALINKEPKGIEIMLEVDSFNHAETLRRTYAGDRSRVVAGEVVSKSTNRSSAAILTTRDHAKHVAQGYTLVKPMGNNHALYSRADVPKEGYQKGTFSLGNAELEGTIVRPEEQGLNSPILLPVVAGGRVIAHRLIMDKKTRELDAGMSIGATESLGNHGGRIVRLAEGDGYNTRIIGMAHADFIANGADANAFTRISVNSRNPQVAEFARLMPREMRESIRTQWGGDMFLRKNQLDLLLGYRKMSIVDSYNRFQSSRDRSEMNVALASGIRLAGDIWQSSIAEVKKRTVLFTPAVIIANGLSNLAVSVLHGMNPVDVARDQREGWTAITQYLRLQKEMSEIQLDISLGKDVQANNLRRSRLQKVMESSGVHSMVQAGMFQSIVEDIDIASDSASPLSATLQRALPDTLGQAVENVYSAAPDSIKKGLGVLMLSPSTEFGASVQAATAKSDFVARYAMLKHLRKEGIAEADAMEQVRDIFIDYAPNTSREMQYINDSGLYMYTKFLMRIQRVIMRAFGNHPEAVLAIEAAQQVLGNYPDVVDSSFLFGISVSGGRSQNPAEVIESLSEFPLFRLIGGLIPDGV